MKQRLLSCLAFSVIVCAIHAEVIVERTPNGGIQPQAAVDEKGTAHLIYLKGDAGASDVFYVRRDAGKTDWTTPIRVNSEPGSAIAAGTIRGAHLALGKNGRVHVAWNGSGAAAKAAGGSAMFYTHLNDAAAAFEPQRNLMSVGIYLDGGGSLAADPVGNVYVIWHASPKGNTEQEAGRVVYVARSTDDGKTFATEKQANTKPTGACGCCGMAAFADKSGNFYALYRAATMKVNRDITLVASRDKGVSFTTASLHPWQIETCAMSSASFAQASAGVLAAWETKGQVYFATINPLTMTAAPPVAAPGAGGQRKHPAVATNAKGETLLAWTEGTGWQRGGSLAWQVFKNGQPTSEKGAANGVPVWGLPTAFAARDGKFFILY